MTKQIALFDIPDERDGIVFNGENAYNVERWVRDHGGHASLIVKATKNGIVPIIRIAQGDLSMQVGDTIVSVDGEFVVE